DFRPPVLRGEFFEIDGGGNADRQAENEGDEEREKRADEGATNPGKLRLAAVAGGKETRVEPALDNTLGAKAFEPGDFQIGDAAGGFRGFIDEHAPGARGRGIERARLEERCADNAVGSDFICLDEAAVYFGKDARERSVENFGLSGGRGPGSQGTRPVFDLDNFRAER